MDRSKKFRSILEEIGGIEETDKDLFLESKAKHLIASSSHLIKYITENYDEETSADLVKRLINSIRTGDEKKFIRGIRNVGNNDE
jgi:hypothetical protein